MPNKKVFISIIVPCYNEEAIIKKNITSIVEYLEHRPLKYQWEILVINDGSKDSTGEIADAIARENSNIRVIHHPVNLNLGRALQTGFRNSKGEIIVVLDIDLSYSFEYIGQMVNKLIETSADIVIASPYMKGGKITDVPFIRRVMSKWVNKFMRVAAQEKYYTYTGMVRAYRGSFIRQLNLKTKDYEINPEIIYKAMILRARIIEIPAHLDWTEQNKVGNKRTSGIKLIQGFFSGLMTAFIFRPYMFFLIIGIILMALSMYEIIWLLADTISGIATLNDLNTNADYSFSLSLAEQFRKNPQSFIVGGITFLASLQFLGLGFLSLQNKRYFEELFHLNSSINKSIKEQTGDNAV
jgi:glycosyltransferase involved in cell wall biosynthesis